MNDIDHLVYAVPNLATGIDEMERLLGVRPAVGGCHPAWGTANALVSLGPDVYLEIIGPDPAEPTPPRLFGIDRLAQARLVGWAVKAVDLEARIQASAERGYDAGRILPGSRRRPDGTLLQWRLVLPDTLMLPCDGLIPFLIDWQGSAHPAMTAPSGCTLLSLRATHPNPPAPRALLHALGVALPVAYASHTQLIARLQTPNGLVELT